MDAAIVHIILTSLIAIVVALLGWSFTRVITDRDEKISLLSTTTDKTLEFIDNQIESIKEKHQKAVDKMKDEFWAELNKQKDNHNNFTLQVTHSMSEMRESILNEIRKLEVSINNKQNR